MTSSVIERWHQFIGGGHDPAVLHDLLDDDAVFYSPAVFSPQQGRAKTAQYLTAAAKMFGGTDFHYIEEWVGDRSAVLEFAATVDGIYVNGIDMIHWNADGRIDHFKVMVRPLKAVNKLHEMMARALQRAAAQP